LTEVVVRATDPQVGLERAAAHRAAEVDPADPVLRRIALRLDAGESVAAVADAFGLGARRLHRMSVGAFGYGPKTLARILRLQRALALARVGVPFADTAFRAGYADQAHLAREVRALAGMAMRQLVPGAADRDIAGGIDQDKGA
jgi:AraC-like DNA-binding protein